MRCSILVFISLAIPACRDSDSVQEPIATQKVGLNESCALILGRHKVELRPYLSENRLHVFVEIVFPVGLRLGVVDAVFGQGDEVVGRAHISELGGTTGDVAEVQSRMYDIVLFDARPEGAARGIYWFRMQVAGETVLLEIDVDKE